MTMTIVMIMRIGNWVMVMIIIIKNTGTRCRKALTFRSERIQPV